MGCLNVDVGYELCKPAVLTNIENGITVLTDDINKEFSVNTEYACSKPVITLGFICRTNIGDQCILWSSDAILLSIKGEYFLTKGR